MVFVDQLGLQYIVSYTYTQKVGNPVAAVLRHFTNLPIKPLGQDDFKASC